MVEVGETAFHERADEVEGEGGAFVRAEEEARIRIAFDGGEAGGVDEVAAEGGEALAIARFEIFGAGFGVLASDAADTDDGFLTAVDEHKAHLEEDLELVGNLGGVAIGKAFGAIAPLQEEAATLGSFGELEFEGFDFPGGDEGRKPGEFGEGGFEGRLRFVGNLVRGGF
jgi:hypothetical protein